MAVPLVLLFAGGPLFLLLRGRRRKRAQEAPAWPTARVPAPAAAGMRPLLANTLLSGTFKTVDPVAVLLDLSARGYLSITPLSNGTGGWWRARPPDDSLRPEEQEVLQAAFGRAPDTTLTAAGRTVARMRGRLRSIARTEPSCRQGWYSLASRRRSRRPGRARRADDLPRRCR